MARRRWPRPWWRRWRPRDDAVARAACRSDRVSTDIRWNERTSCEGGRPMKGWIRSTGAVLALVLLLPLAALAQATGQINGLVTDTQGGVLPGVTVEVTNLATGAVRTAVTGADGLYTVPLLQPGDYSVKASLSGFRTALQERVRVTVTETARVAFELEVGQLTETVTVTGAVTLVETSN